MRYIIIILLLFSTVCVAEVEIEDFSFYQSRSNQKESILVVYLNNGKELKILMDNKSLKDINVVWQAVEKAIASQEYISH